MSVIAIKTEPKCKLCRHEKRAEIDAILELRSNLTRGPETEDGKKGELLWPLSRVLEQLAEWEVPNPTEENVKGHWRKHCQVTTSKAVAEAQEVSDEEIERILAGGAHADVDDSLRLVVSLWQAQVRQRAARGEAINISTQDMMKAAAELTRRQHNETQAELMSTFTQGLGLALGAQPKQIEGAEVVEATEYRVEDVEEAEVAA